MQDLIKKIGGSNSFKGTPTSSGLGIAGALVAGGLIITGLNSSLFNVEGGYRAIKFSRISGVKETVYNEGTHFAIPWFETPILFDVRAKPRNIASISGTKDLQMVNITLRVLSKPRIDKLSKIYQTLGVDYDEKVLPSIVNEVLKSVVAQFTISQLISQREKVSFLVREQLIKRASQFNLILDDVSITHVNFSQEFTSAVESKQVAQQDAQRASYVVDRAKQEKQSIIVKAEGEAAAAQLIGESIKNKPGFLELRKIEAAREIAQNLKDSKNRVFVDSDLLLLNGSSLSHLLTSNQQWVKPLIKQNYTEAASIHALSLLKSCPSDQKNSASTLTVLENVSGNETLFIRCVDHYKPFLNSPSIPEIKKMEFIVSVCENLYSFQIKSADAYANRLIRKYLPTLKSNQSKLPPSLYRSFLSCYFRMLENTRDRKAILRQYKKPVPRLSWIENRSLTFNKMTVLLDHNPKSRTVNTVLLDFKKEINRIRKMSIHSFNPHFLNLTSRIYNSGFSSFDYVMKTYDKIHSFIKSSKMDHSTIQDCVLILDTAILNYISKQLNGLHPLYIHQHHLFTETDRILTESHKICNSYLRLRVQNPLMWSKFVSTPQGHQLCNSILKIHLLTRFYNHEIIPFNKFIGLFNNLCCEGFIPSSTTFSILMNATSLYPEQESPPNLDFITDDTFIVSTPLTRDQTKTTNYYSTLNIQPTTQLMKLAQQFGIDPCKDMYAALFSAYIESTDSEIESIQKEFLDRFEHTSETIRPILMHYIKYGKMVKFGVLWDHFKRIKGLTLDDFAFAFRNADGWAAALLMINDVYHDAKRHGVRLDSNAYYYLLACAERVEDYAMVGYFQSELNRLSDKSY